MKEILFSIKDILLSPIRGINGGRREFRERAMRRLRHSPQSFVENWCRRHGYTELQSKGGEWWAIPPGGVIPVPLHQQENWVSPTLYLFGEGGFDSLEESDF